MSKLTKETIEEAKKLRIPTTLGRRAAYSGYNIQEMINFLESHKNLPNAIIISGSDSYSDPEIIIEWQVERTEEDVQRAIRYTINELNVKKKFAERAALSKSKRIELEIKDLEKQLARKKKALAK